MKDDKADHIMETLAIIADALERIAYVLESSRTPVGILCVNTQVSETSKRKMYRGKL
jgi:hypothetical protein